MNVATSWGVTARTYTQLQQLYQRYREKGLEILAFPCNQFGKQEPGTNAQIKQAATSKYGVTFHLFSKIEVNGPNALPVFTWLKEKLGGGDIKWNFEKFLVDHTGKSSLLVFMFNINQ